MPQHIPKLTNRIWGTLPNRHRADCRWTVDIWISKTRQCVYLIPMTETEHAGNGVATMEEVQNGWTDLKVRVGQLEAERTLLEQENKSLRTLLERVIEHRQKSHNELVLLLTGLVSKLPINDVGVVISRLVEHNTNVTQMLAAFIKGTADANLPQPTVLKALDQTKRELVAALK